MQIHNNINKQSMTWRVSLGFVVLATLIVVLVGYLSSIGLLPISQAVEFDDRKLQFISVWMKLAIALGLVLPTIAFVVGFSRLELRKIFGFYLLLVIVQIVTEQVISTNWMPSLVVPIGTLYTAFRVWQLWQGLQLIKSARRPLLKNKLLTGVLWLIFYFWLANLAVLFTIGWASIL